MTRTKKYAAAAAVAAVLAGVPTGAYAAAERDTAPPSTATAAPAPQEQQQKQERARSHAQEQERARTHAQERERARTSGIRLVRPGERVDAGRGYTLWLTPDGKHWSGPDGFENFRSVVDGNIDRSRPGISHQSEGDGSGVFHSGVYYGTEDAARVELVAADGTRTPASLVELPGEPGWGAWYAHTPPSGGTGGPGVALYDR
ncbi:hypothetical protein ACE14D_17935, partial [Streptomyces sp. Act-28]